MQDQYRRVAGGTKTGASSISKNYNGTYSAQRQELVEQQPTYRALSEEFAQKVVEPDYQKVVEIGVALGLIEVPPEVDPDTLYDVDIPTPAMPWIDPQKEAKAAQTLVDACLESRAHIMRTRGRDPDTVRRQIESERKYHPVPDKTTTKQPTNPNESPRQ